MQTTAAHAMRSQWRPTQEIGMESYTYLEFMSSKDSCMRSVFDLIRDSQCEEMPEETQARLAL